MHDTNSVAFYPSLLSRGARHFFPTGSPKMRQSTGGDARRDRAAWAVGARGDLPFRDDRMAVRRSAPFWVAFRCPAETRGQGSSDRSLRDLADPRARQPVFVTRPINERGAGCLCGCPSCPGCSPFSLHPPVQYHASGPAEGSLDGSGRNDDAEGRKRAWCPHTSKGGGYEPTPTVQSMQRGHIRIPSRIGKTSSSA